ncbi:anti-sigma factor antagonist [Betaproteobacteria bacterium]|nr:anti-sigma factor antagonist [Betaproteobacteria bacterium]
MQIAQQQQGDFLVLTLEGDLDAVTAPTFEAICDKLLEAGTRYVVLDLAGVSFISSAGLRSILILAKKLRPVQGELRFARMQAVVTEVFVLCGFDALFSTFPDVASAIVR